MKIKLNNDMELVVDNENGNGACIASLVDCSDGEIILADVIDEEILYEYITSHISNTKNIWAVKVAELRSLEPGEPVYVCDGQLAYFEAFEQTENGDYTLWFTDDGLYKNKEDGEYYDLETDERADDYIGNCSLGEYIGRVDKERKLDKAKEIINAYSKAEFGSDSADFRSLRKVNLAFTETEDGKHEIQVDANLIDFSIVKSVDNTVVEEIKYESLSELIEKELEGMSFDDLVWLSDEQLAPFYVNNVTKEGVGTNEPEIGLKENEIAIKFIKQPDNFGYNVVGEVYKQEGPFKWEEHDWNNDGDVYSQKVAVFHKLTNVNKYASQKFYLSDWEFKDLMESKCIEYVAPDRSLASRIQSAAERAGKTAGTDAGAKAPDKENVL